MIILKRRAMIICVFLPTKVLAIYTTCKSSGGIKILRTIVEQFKVHKLGYKEEYMHGIFL